MRIPTHDLDAIAAVARHKFSMRGDLTLKIMSIGGVVPVAVGTYCHEDYVWRRIDGCESIHLRLATVEVFGPRAGYKGSLSVQFDRFGVQRVYHTDHGSALFFRDDLSEQYPVGEWNFNHARSHWDQTIIYYLSQDRVVFTLKCNNAFTDIRVNAPWSRSSTVWGFIGFFYTAAWDQFIELYPSAEQVWDSIVLDDADRIRLKLTVCG